MPNPIRNLFALLLAFVAVRASGQTQDAGQAPRLRVTQMTGDLQVSGPGPSEDASGLKGLPYIQPGSTVRVLSGSASFESDTHAAIAAAAGDTFRFTSKAQDGAAPAAMRVAAVGREAVIYVEVGGKKFVLQNEGALDIASQPSGETPISVLGGGVELLPGSVFKEGENIVTLADAREEPGMAEGETITAHVPEGRAFELASVDVSSLKVQEQDDTTFLARTPHPAASSAENPAAEVIAAWPPVSRWTAEVMSEKYGPPNEVGASKLVWTDNAPWKQTIVYKNSTSFGFSKKHPSILQQIVNYDVPADKARAITKLGARLKADRDLKELSVTSGSEAANFLAINLADDVINDRLSVAEAKDAYARTLALADSGKTSPDTKGFRFAPK